MAGSRSGQSARGAGQPPRQPEGTPERAAPFDHSFTLQAVMELQKTVAVLGEKIDRMTTDVSGISASVEATNDKLDKLKHWQTIVTGGALAVAALAGIIWSVVTFVPWDRIRIEPASSAQVDQAAQAKGSEKKR